MLRGAGIAFRTHVAALTAARTQTLLLFGAGAALVVVAVAYFVGLIDDQELAAVRMGVLAPGVPLAAILVAELPLREGIAYRTLLYPLLGPVPRSTLAVVRTLVTMGLLAVGALVPVLVLGLIGGVAAGTLVRELGAAVLAAAAYAGLFGLLHLVTKRGLVAGLVLFGIVDQPLARLPFALRNLSPLAHVRIVAGHPLEYGFGLDLPEVASSAPVSALVLFVLAALATALTAVRFARRDIGELC